MYRSVMDDSITYYDSDIPINFVKSSLRDKSDTTALVKSHFQDSSMLNQTSYQYGKTAHKKRRQFGHTTDNNEHDSLLEMTINEDLNMKSSQLSPKSQSKPFDSIFTQKQSRVFSRNNFCNTTVPFGKNCNRVLTSETQRLLQSV